MLLLLLLSCLTSFSCPLFSTGNYLSYLHLDGLRPRVLMQDLFRLVKVQVNCMKVCHSVCKVLSSLFCVVFHKVMQPFITEATTLLNNGEMITSFLEKSLCTSTYQELCSSRIDFLPLWIAFLLQLDITRVVDSLPSLLPFYSKLHSSTLQQIAYMLIYNAFGSAEEAEVPRWSVSC